MLLTPNIQLFAEGDTATADTGTNPGAGSGADNQNQDTNQGEQEKGKTYTQADVDRLLQAEADRRVQQALKTFKENELPTLLEGAKTEAEKLAKMTADQKADHEKKRQEEALAEREKEITRRELRATALESLAEKGLPKALVEIVDCTGADQCNNSLKAIEKAFRAAVDEAVNEKLKGKTPAGGNGQTDPPDEFQKRIDKYRRK